MQRNKTPQRDSSGKIPLPKVKVLPLVHSYFFTVLCQLLLSATYAVLISEPLCWCLENTYSNSLTENKLWCMSFALFTNDVLKENKDGYI